MLIEVDDKVVEEIRNLTRAEKNHRAAGRSVKSRLAHNLLIDVCKRTMLDIVGEANSNEYAQEQIDTARTLGEGE